MAHPVFSTKVALPVVAPATKIFSEFSRHSGVVLACQLLSLLSLLAVYWNGRRLRAASSPAAMGKYNFSAFRVRQSVINQKANGKISKLPEWVDVLGDIPPSQVVVRNQPQRHQLVKQRLTIRPLSTPFVENTAVPKRVQPKKPSRMFQPMPIRFEEDQLRKDFFRDHPWELARPRVIVESTGNDSEHHDWSRIQQPGKKLDGESVVQRQLWLLHNVPHMKKGVAYDIARREFYRHRHREDIERRVAAEEAEASGATFGPRRLDIGMQLENEEYERWKEWAKTQSQGELKEMAPSGVPEEAAEDTLSPEDTGLEEPSHPA